MAHGHSIKLPQSNKVNCLYYLLPVRAQEEKNKTGSKPTAGRGRPGKNTHPKLTYLDDGTAKITLGDDYVFIENYDALSFRGGYRASTYKLLDYLIWKLDEAGSGVDLLVPLADYMECCGYADTIQKRKDIRKEMKKDLRLLCATKLGKDAVRILDAGGVHRGQITVRFSPGMADYILRECPYMWYPLKLLQLSSRSPLAYSMGRKLALHSSIYHNQERGTHGVLSVKTLMKYCRSLPAADEVRNRNGNFRQTIISPFTEVLDTLLEEDIIDWKYRNAEEMPENYALFLADSVEYMMQRMPLGRVKKHEHKERIYYNGKTNSRN